MPPQFQGTAKLALSNEDGMPNPVLIPLGDTFPPSLREPQAIVGHLSCNNLDL